jgi:hypothetical protein
MVYSETRPAVSSLAAGHLLGALLNHEEYAPLIEERLSSVQGEIDQLNSLAEWHLNEFSSLSDYGEDFLNEQSVGDETLYFLNWLIAPLRGYSDSVAFETQVNFAIKKTWLDEVGSLSESVIRNQEITLNAWSVGKPLWKNGRSYPATLQIDVLGSEIYLAYSGLLEHLAGQELQFLAASPNVTEIARTAIVWRFSAMFEALANTGSGPKRAIEYIFQRASKSIPDHFRKSSPRWNEEVVNVRNAFSHIVGSLKSNYEVPDVDWTIKLIENGTILTASALSFYFDTEISAVTARGWWDRTLGEMNY